MFRARGNAVQSMPYITPREDYDIDMIPLPETGHTNDGYENTTETTTNLYEDPSIIAQLFVSHNATRHRNNDLYEPAGPLAWQVRKDHLHHSKDSCSNRLVLFLILTVSVVALVLVALMITGYIGPSCLCSSQGPQQQKSSSSIVSMEPIMEELERMKRNMSHVNTIMMKQESTVNDLKTKLTSAWQAIDILETKLGQRNISNLNMKTIQQQLENMEKELKITDSRMEKEIISLHSKGNDTRTLLFQAESDITALWKTVDLSKNQTHSLSSMVSEMNNTINIQHQDTINKINTKTSELANKDRILQENLQQLNSTLTNKVANVSKMAGPIGPRGFNGTQGPRGYTGINGSTGFNGSNGAPGPQGMQGTPGAGNLSLCGYKESTQKASAGAMAQTSIKIWEAADKRITGVYCHSNRAALVNLVSSERNSLRLYSCECKGETSFSISSSIPSLECTISYWECPRTTK